VALAALVEGMMMAITAIVTRVEWMDGSEGSVMDGFMKMGTTHHPNKHPSKAACCRHVAHQIFHRSIWPRQNTHHMESTKWENPSVGSLIHLLKIEMQAS
jgi:hypothetical protein